MIVCVVFHPHPQHTILQARIEAFADLRVLHAANDAAVVALQDRVAARNRGQRADRFQRARQPMQMQRMPLQCAYRRGLWAWGIGAFAGVVMVTVGLFQLLLPTDTAWALTVGFLGGYLALELLARTDADVWCVVRAPDPARALARVRSRVEALAGRYGWPDGRAPRCPSPSFVAVCVLRSAAPSGRYRL